MERLKQLQALVGQLVRLVCQGKETGRKQHVDGVLRQLPIKGAYGIFDGVGDDPVYVMQADQIDCISQNYTYLPPTLFMEVCDDGKPSAEAPHA